jgi:hypothetical protein
LWLVVVLGIYPIEIVSIIQHRKLAGPCLWVEIFLISWSLEKEGIIIVITSRDLATGTTYEYYRY